MNIVGNITVTGGSGSNVPRNLYKYTSYKKEKTLYITKNVTKKAKINVEESLIVRLGGPFEEIGGTNASLGGGNQKVG